LEISSSGVTYTIPNSNKNWTIFYNGLNTIFSSSGSYIELTAEQGVILGRVDSVYVYSDSNRVSLASYISSHAGTAVFG
jgi:hypothetical protein